ncbi:MAG: hypothetical protein MI919_28130 [Holophagales bacterium]|nr:hypothetical protein [Holophagales bacterium]
MSFTQLSVQNVTPARRRIFLSASEIDTAKVNELVSRAWKAYLLDTGETGLAAYGSSFQVVARSSNPRFQHQSVQATADLGSAWRFTAKDGVPDLSAKGSATQNAIEIENQSGGEASVSLHNDASQLMPAETLLTGFTVQISPKPELFFYASVPVTDPESPIVLEPEVGKASVAAGFVEAQLLLEEGRLRWQFQS